MGQLKGRAQVPIAQSSFGFVCPRSGTTNLKAKPSTKLQAGEKQPLLVTLSRHRAEGQVMGKGGCFVNVHDLAGS